MLRKKFRAGDLVSVVTTVHFDSDTDSDLVHVNIGLGAIANANQVKLLRPIFHAGEEVEEIISSTEPEVTEPRSGTVIAMDGDHVWLRTATEGHLTLLAKDLQLRKTNPEQREAEICSK